MDQQAGSLSRPPLPATAVLTAGGHGLEIPGLPGALRDFTGSLVRQVFPGHAAQVRHARKFVAAALSDCPVADTAVLLASELATNAVIHSRSGTGGMFEVSVWRGPSSAGVAVSDGGSQASPSPGDAGSDRESGYGLLLVATLSGHWGYSGGPDGRTTWFLLRWAG
jgi:serine/threonine-protein kinase RsbW